MTGKDETTSTSTSHKRRSSSSCQNATMDKIETIGRFEERLVRTSRLVAQSSSINSGRSVEAYDSIRTDVVDDDAVANDVQEEAEEGITTLQPIIKQSEPTQLHDVGLMITMTADNKCQFQLIPDEHYPEIHPNVYAPKDLMGMKTLYGGGSGVSVFGAKHPTLGDIVMKHGGWKDLQELFALATISKELTRRSQMLHQREAADDMQKRLASFEMIYISPHHIMSRGKELVSMLRKFVNNWSNVRRISDSFGVEETTSSRVRDGTRRNNPLRFSVYAKEQQKYLPSKEVQLGITLRIFEDDGTSDVPTFALNKISKPQVMSLTLPAKHTQYYSSTCFQVSSGHRQQAGQDNGTSSGAYETLQAVVDNLSPIMNDNLFKFTLGQKSIGNADTKTGNQWLYEGKLQGPILKRLLDEFIQVIENLQRLTLPEEVDVVEEVVKEVERFENDSTGPRADSVTPVADAFVGNCIKKNYHPVKGRQKFLREICTEFRENRILLAEEEEIPAHHLGNLLQSGALMNETYVNSPMEPAVLQDHSHFWRNVLRRAVVHRNDRTNTNNAIKQIWTCGLTDAGIHNLFVSEKELYLFDLGEPQLMSLPGFLTKFMFSFLHTLGMEGDGHGSWVNRFKVVGDKLALTAETRNLLPKAYDAFEETLNRIIAELFDNDDHLRWLLLTYVTMQLKSDAAFCIQKWQIKGGGKPRAGNHQKNLEKWLWRALWDIYVAFDINTAQSWCRLGVVHPHFQFVEQH